MQLSSALYIISAIDGANEWCDMFKTQVSNYIRVARRFIIIDLERKIEADINFIKEIPITA